MGTHPNLPSKLATDGSSLKDYLEKNPHLLDERVRKHYGGDDLPFLFKVLAIGKALSIQAHPDKKLAQKLFKEKPDVYKGVCSVKHIEEHYVLAMVLTSESYFCRSRFKSQST